MIKLFLGIFTRLKRIFINILTCFSNPGFWPRTGWQARSVDRSVDRTKGRSTVRSTDVHRAVHVWQPSGPVDRAVDRRAQTCTRLLAQWAGRPVGRPDQRALLSVSGRSTERSTGLPQRSHLWPLAVDRMVDCKPVRLPDQPNG